MCRSMSILRLHISLVIYTKDKELLERVQHKFTRMIKKVRDKDYLDRL